MKTVTAFLFTSLVLALQSIASPEWSDDDAFERVLWSALVANGVSTGGLTEAEFEAIKLCDGDISTADGDTYRDYIGDESDTQIAKMGDNDGWVNFVEFTFGSNMMNDFYTPAGGADATSVYEYMLQKSSSYSTSNRDFEMRLKHNVNLDACGIVIRFSVMLWDNNSSPNQLVEVWVPTTSVTKSQVGSASGDTAMDEFIYTIDITSIVTSTNVIPFRGSMESNSILSNPGETLRFKIWVTLPDNS